MRLSAMLVFAAFVVLWRERQGPSRLGLLALAGILAGLAATVEFPVALIGAILCLYAVARGGALRRAAAYAGGALIGGLPTLLYNRWAFGHPFKFPTRTIVSAPGAVTQNRTGLYGVTAPKFHVLVELLFARIGLLTLMPVLALGAVGLVFLYRSGRRAEALVAAAISLTYLLLIAGYETPFGGFSPGPGSSSRSCPSWRSGSAPPTRGCRDDDRARGTDRRRDRRAHARRSTVGHRRWLVPPLRDAAFRGDAFILAGVRPRRRSHSSSS